MLFQLREEYYSQGIGKGDLDENPIVQFGHWFQEILQAGISEPNAMTLATATPDGQPSARIVLLKDYSPAGFTFFTNYESRKATELDTNPHAALVFFWPQAHRQVRIQGKAEKVAREISERYFQSRPLGSQIGAWASPQSKILENRQVLEDKVAELEAKYAGQDYLPLPGFWGGYCVVPTLIEFWQGRSSRLHDRFRYILNEDKSWKIEQLAP